MTIHQLPIVCEWLSVKAVVGKHDARVCQKIGKQLLNLSQTQFRITAEVHPPRLTGRKASAK